MLTVGDVLKFKEQQQMLTYDQCCMAIVDDAKADGYAKAYARAGLGMTGEMARVQCLYILNNITHWRAPIAKQVRAALREYSKKQNP